MLLNGDVVNEQVNEVTGEIPPARSQQLHQIPTPALQSPGTQDTLFRGQS